MNQKSEIRCQKSGFSRRSFSFLLFISALIFALPIRAQEAPTITVTKGDRINLTVSPLSGGEGAAATKTLQNDLNLSGYFILGGNASYTVRGTASAGNLQGQVVDRSGGD